MRYVKSVTYPDAVDAYQLKQYIGFLDEEGEVVDSVSEGNWLLIDQETGMISYLEDHIFQELYKPEPESEMKTYTWSSAGTINPVTFTLTNNLGSIYSSDIWDANTKRYINIKASL
jgi:hypothetical protein